MKLWEVIKELQENEPESVAFTHHTHHKVQSGRRRAQKNSNTGTTMRPIKPSTVALVIGTAMLWMLGAVLLGTSGCDKIRMQQERAEHITADVMKNGNIDRLARQRVIDCEQGVICYPGESCIQWRMRPAICE